MSRDVLHAVDEMVSLYGAGRSLPEISGRTGVPISTVRGRLLGAGVRLRSRSEGVRLAGAKISRAHRGRVRGPMGEQARQRLSAARRARPAAGRSLKPSGYVEITRGPDKGRLEHDVAFEGAIGRRLGPGECVHHRDHDRQNNDLSNLELMTRSGHARHHAIENLPNRQRDEHGRFR